MGINYNKNVRLGLQVVKIHSLQKKFMIPVPIILVVIRLIILLNQHLFSHLDSGCSEYGTNCNK